MSLLRRCCWPLLAIAAVIGAVAVHADRKAADFFVQRGEKALRAKDWAEAQGLFRKAIDEEAGHMPALNGLGDARYGAGERAGAIEAWRQVVAASEGGATVPPAWTEVLARAKTRLADLEASEAAFAKLLDGRVAALLELADRWREKDPDVAVKALREVLRLKPGHPGATEALQGLGGTAASEWTTIFDGADLSGFVEPDPTVWKLVNGVMVGDLTGGTYMFWTQGRSEGDFDVRMEARITKAYTARRALLLAGAVASKYQATQCGALGPELVVRETDGEMGDERSELAHRESIAALPPAYDLSDWTSYELQFRGPKVRFVLNGTLLAECPRRPNRTQGKAAIVLQDARVEVRRFQVAQR
ncbi:MAG: family 16 glycoside hydrolase [Planctomycetota bacterium]